MIKLKTIQTSPPFGRQILALHPDSKDTSLTKNEKWFISVDERNDEVEEEEEIYWRGCTVVISSFDACAKNCFLKKCYTVDTDIREVFYTYFHLKEKNSKPCRCLCIMEKECLNVFTEAGELFIAPLPFKVKRIWALHNGVCVERETSLELELEKKSMPTLFSLTHPLEDFKPIVYRYQDSRKPMYFTDTTQHIVFTEPDTCLILTYDSVLGLHSLWKARKALEQDFPEGLSHQDSLPEFLAFCNHSTNMADINNQSRLSLSPAPNKRHSCPPISLHYGNKHRVSPAKCNSPMVKHYSPSVPNHFLRGSPQQAFHDSTVNGDFSAPRKSRLSSPMMFRMSCDESVIEDDLEPLPPDICLDQVWQEQGNMIRHGIKGKAEEGFITKDFSGKQYVGYFIKALSKLRLLRIKENSKHGSSFEKVLEIECFGFGSFQNCAMFAVLDLSENIQLYSGKQKIGPVQLSASVFNKNITKQQLSLKHFGATSFVVEGGNEAVRIEISELTYSTTVKSCIKALEDVITEQEFNLIVAKYYTLFHSDSSGYNKQIHINEWDKFLSASLKLLGFPESSTKSLKENITSPAPPQPKKAKKSDSLVGIEDWEYLLQNQVNNMMQTKVEQKYIVEISLQKNAPLYKHITAVFTSWHKLYEEFKLNTLFLVHLVHMAKLLHYLAIILNSKSHTKIYETDFPTLQQKNDTVYKLKEEYVGKPLSITSYDECNIHEIFSKMMLAETKFNCDTKKKTTAVLSKVFSAIAKYSQSEHKEKRKASLDGQPSLFEIITDIMLKESFTPDDLAKLPLGFKMPIKEILYHYKNTENLNLNAKSANYLGREDFTALQKQKHFHQAFKPAYQNTDDLSDFQTEIFKLRFNQDLRVNEVKRLLNSSKPVNITLIQKPDVNDHAFAKEEEAKLLLLNNRTMALPVARGMFTLGTSQPVASETVSIPVLELTGRSTTNNKTVQVNQTDAPASRQLWPSFHNGVAAGLKIAPGASQIDSTWILFNKLKYADLTADHSGFLFALGLTGHLSVLPKWNLHDYLSKGHELTTVALLLGISTTQIGSRNSDTYRLLSLHLDSLLPPTALELNVPPSSQVAAVVSLGLLFFQSADSHLVKVLLHEIGRSPGPELENAFDRESHALGAGFALGMIMINEGKDSQIVGGINVHDVLYRYVFGGQKYNNILGTHEKMPVSSCQIKEGDLIDTNVTSPAAVIAISLMYLRTNNKNISNWLNVPILDSVMDIMKPDDALLRVLAYNLIMWDNIVPSTEWLEEFIPGITSLFTSDDNLNNDTMKSIPLQIQYLLSMVSGCLLALGLKFAGSANQASFDIMFPWIKRIQNVMGSPICEELHAKVPLEHCLNTVLISVSLVMAGTGSIKVLRVARQLHKRCSPDVWYGNHMASHMAIGFLFLGGGRYTLKTDNLSIASLLCAVYPKWPISSKDNRFHLQALRHLYVLACEQRLAVTRDIDSDQICYCPLQVTLMETDAYPETDLKLLSPCLLPELKCIKQIKVMGPRYWSVTLSGKISLEKISNIFVKKKCGHLSYSEDPKGYRKLLGRTFISQSDKLDLVKSFNSNRTTALFEQIFCIPLPNKRKSKLYEFCSNTLYECVVKDKMDLLEDYLFIENAVREVENGEVSRHSIQQLKFLYNYYDTVHSDLIERGAVEREPLINNIYLMQTKLRLEKRLKRSQKISRLSTDAETVS
ncbi:anaphase-promoting complex subunit 1-like isoform X2 [Hydractinia symbiolongicarpus]|uniref:anaphase-promoting complex subunit 1-like isoform X2 n=1 Tax=Hydractinia symbiolongicarpus TaxID=13093 RepID=UPI00254E9B69|nr:anaphase-promoting complex subunit 1-like isoform X2 [Hydractinia symbiolongicarpus]